MKTNLYLKMTEKLSEVQLKAKANIINEKDLLDICDNAEKKAIELMKLSDRFDLRYNYWFGETKKGWSYTSTGITLKFNKSGTIKDFQISRSKHGYSASRIEFNDNDFSELELKLLRKHEGLNKQNSFEV